MANRDGPRWQRCPVCEGTGVVNRPPGIAADQQTFTSTSAGPWPCQTCKAQTIILTPTTAKDDSQ